VFHLAPLNVNQVLPNSCASHKGSEIQKMQSLLSDRRAYNSNGPICRNSIIIKSNCDKNFFSN
jgi:hypothetical protein